MKTIKLIKQNENKSIGVFQNTTTGEFLAMTFTASKTFKTKTGAIRWLVNRGHA